MRKSGVLLSVSSLPSKYGIGCFDVVSDHFGLFMEDSL